MHIDLVLTLRYELCHNRWAEKLENFLERTTIICEVSSSGKMKLVGVFEFRIAFDLLKWTSLLHNHCVHI